MWDLSSLNDTKSLQPCVRLFVTLWTAALLCPWDFPNKNTGVDCHALLQGIFLTQESNLCLLRLPELAGKFFTSSATWEALSKCVLVAQSCLTLCNTMDCSPPGSSVCGIFQARILEWVAIPFSKGSSQPRDWTCVSCIAGHSLPSEPGSNPHPQHWKCGVLTTGPPGKSQWRL